MGFLQINSRLRAMNPLNNELLRFKTEQKFLIYDTETCHLNTVAKNYPWQVGFIVCTLNEILESHCRYIYWDDMNNKISEQAKKVTHFDYAKYAKEAKPQREVLDFVESYLYDNQYVIAGHNTHAFDSYILSLWRRENGLKRDYSYLPRAIDTNSLAKMVKLGVKEAPRKDWMTLMFRFSNFSQRGMKTNLTALGKEYGIGPDLINYDNLHDATEDVKLNYYVFKQLINRIDI